MKRVIIYITAIGFFGTACNNDPKKTDVSAVDADTTNTKLVSVNKDSLLASTGKQVLQILKNKQYDSLVQYFSDSVHFSPYGFIGSGKQTLTANDFIGLLSSVKKINWGSYDGTGDPIDLTLQQYFEKFVYDADFLHAEKTGIDSFIQNGNALHNLHLHYFGSRFIEYHFSGFDKKYNGMDWVSLRLVFKEMNNEYLLVAIVHDQWTI